jgi:hypothetical protein
MSISVNWLTKVITIPKSDLTLVQSSPNEIYELNLNELRYWLHDEQDSVEGIVNLEIFTHNTEAELGGITFARVIRIINGYTITFENGSYAVNLIGANSNVADVTNVNNVSVRPYNSAGLISSPDIEYSSFNERVTIDVVNGTSGTLYPKGTMRDPVNNLSDAKIIASYRGFETIFVIGDITFSDTDNIDGFTVIGQNPIKSSFSLIEGLSSEGCEFIEATINGVLDGNSTIDNCIVDDLTYIEGIIKNSILRGTIILAGNTTTNILNCYDGIAGDDKPIIDMGGSGQGLTIGGYSGELEIRNKNGTDKVSIDLVSGEVVLDSTVTNGEIDIRGVGRLIDNSSGGAIVKWNALISNDNYDGVVVVDTVSGVPGTQYPRGTYKMPVDNLIDAKIIADNLGIKTLSILGDVTLEENFEGFTFSALHFSHTTIDLNGVTLTRCIMNSVTVVGESVGFFIAEKCNFPNGLSNVDASMEDSILNGTISVIDGGQLRCIRGSFPGTETILDLSGEVTVSLSDIVGSIKIINLDNVSSIVTITGNFSANIDSTCTSGIVKAAGIGILNDSSLGTLVIDKVLPGSLSVSPTNDSVGSPFDPNGIYP